MTGCPQLGARKRGSSIRCEKTGGTSVYHFRDQQGLEVDFLFPDAKGGLRLAECKASKTVNPAMAAPLAALGRAALGSRPVELAVVYRDSPSAPDTQALAPGVRALRTQAFVESLGG